MSEFTNILEERYGAGEPILTEDILSAFPDDARSTVFYRIKSATESSELSRYAHGVYYIPERVEIFGRNMTLPLDAEKVIARKYLRDGGCTIGFVSGLALENRSRISNQVPAVLEITTNVETSRRRCIAPFGGYREIVLKRPRVPVTDGNVAALEAIDLIGRVDAAALNECELEAFRQKVAAADVQTLASCLAAYPKRVISKYLEGISLGLVPA